MLLELFSGTIMPAHKDRIALEYVNDCKTKLNANPISILIKGLLEVDPAVRAPTVANFCGAFRRRRCLRLCRIG